MKSEQTLEKNINLIEKLLLGKNSYEGWFSTWDDSIDYIVKYEIGKITLKESRSELAKYEGKIEVIVNELWIGNRDLDTWEGVYGWDDIPESAWDDIRDDITMNLEKFLPHIWLDVDFTSNL